jgi:regulation of enolase protein 1 (concanavalin A-like superfamily)
MSTDTDVSIPRLPRPLRWLGSPEAWSVDGDALTIRSGARTDWFIDPGPGTVTLNAPAVVMPAEGSWMLRALVSAEHLATFDAGVLAVHVSEHTWAKLCLERSPQGQVMVVSVVTNGRSDDCNSVPVAGAAIWCRIARLERAYAFHVSQDGRSWSLVRYFGLVEEGPVSVGFLSQSPTGDGCTATFRDITFVPELLSDVRSGI